MIRRRPTYRDRDRLLATLGFPSYRAYLASPLWASIRLRLLRHHGPLCRLCYSEAEQFHHVDYNRKTLVGLRLDTIFPLCRRCHLQVEFDWRGRKRTLAETQTTFARLVRRGVQRRLEL